MNTLSVVLLAIVCGTFIYTVRYIVRKNRRNPGCGSCNCCGGDSQCCLRRK